MDRIGRQSSGDALMFLGLALLGSIMAIACQPRSDEGVARGTWTATSAPLPTEALRSAVSLRAEDELVLDARADGTILVGRADPVPLDTDPVRTLRVRWIANRQELPWSQAGRALRDAHLLPGGGALIVTDDGTLSILADPGPTSVAIPVDRDVTVPLSVTSDGRFAAYARGEAPDLQVVRLDIAHRTTQVLSPALEPAWCPAISADGEAVVFVASVGGFPELHRVEVRTGAHSRWSVGGTKRSGVALVPNGPSAPVLLDDVLVFETDDGLVALARDGSTLASVVGARALAYVPEAGVFLAHATPEGGALRSISLAEPGRLR